MNTLRHLRLGVIAGAQIAFTCGPVVAGTVFGNGGATEVTQIANNIQLILQYEQQVQGYLRQGLQLEAELKNLIQNPASLLGADVGNLINGVSKVMSGGMAIGGTMAQIDKNFGSTFKSPTADTLARSFTRWNQTSTDTLEGALKSIGMHRDQFASDNAAIHALYDEAQASEGNLQAVSTLAKINAKGLEQNQQLQDLLLTQHSAESTYMAAQVAKSDKLETDRNNLLESYTPVTTEITTTKAIQWKNIFFKK